MRPDRSDWDHISERHHELLQVADRIVGEVGDTQFAVIDVPIGRILVGTEQPIPDQQEQPEREAPGPGTIVHAGTVVVVSSGVGGTVVTG